MNKLGRIHYEGNILDELENLKRRLTALEHTELSGVVGPQGPTGATGAQGPDGAGSPAGAVQGDIVYYDATPEAAALNIGTAEQVLRTNAGATAPEWATIDNDSIANRTRTLFVPAVGCYNATDASQQNCEGPGWNMADTKECRAFGFLYCPSDYVSSMTVNGIMDPRGTGNAYVQMDVGYGALGEAWNNHTDSQGPTAEAVTNQQRDRMTTATSLANLAAGDYINLKFTRFGDNVLDTVGAIVYFVGFLVSYTADM